MEDKKFNVFFIISSALALIFTVFVFYNTVLNQIISQNQGYFYALIFGLILLISFVICNLFTKLIAISDNYYDELTIRVAVIGILVVLSALFLLVRMRYSTSVSPNEFPCYKIATALINDTFVQSQDLVNDAMYNPGHFLYALILSLFINIFGEGSRLVLWINAVFIIGCAILIYNIVAKLSDRVCGIFAAALMLLMPSQTFSVYSVSPEPLITAICLGCILVFVYLFSIDSESLDEIDDEEGIINTATLRGMPLIMTFVAAFLAGLMILVEPVMVIFVALLAITGFALKKTAAFNILISFVAGVVIFALLCFAKTGLTGLDIGETIAGEMSAFDACVNQTSGNEDDFSTVFDKFCSDISSSEESVSDNYYFIVKSSGENVYSDLNGSWIIILNQILFMFTLLMTLSCVVLSVKEKQENSSIIYSALVGSLAAMFFSQNRDKRGYLFVELLVIASSIGIHYLYLDHHPEEIVTLNPLDALEKTGRKEIAAATRSNLQAARSMEEEEFTKRAEALIFLDSDEDLYNEIKKEEHRKLMTKDGHGNVLDDTFDDYDDDFFLDSEDDSSEDVTVISVAPSGTTERKGKDAEAYEINANMHAAAKLNKAKIPVWKVKNNSYDNEDFDDDDKESSKSNEPEDEPNVTKINRASRSAVKTEKEPKSIKPSKEPKSPKPLIVPKEERPSKTKGLSGRKEDATPERSMKAVSSATNKMTNGTAVRRVKTVREAGAVPKNIADMAAEEKYIPNPLPVPEKREHKQMDFDIDNTDDEDWDI